VVGSTTSGYVALVAPPRVITPAQTTAEEHGTDAIGSRIRSGLAWKAGSQITLQISRMAVALILARLLTPHDWGLAAMVLLFSSFVIVFTDSALGTALIQRRDLSEDDKSTVFWASAGIGVFLMIGGIALSGPLASFYGEPEVRPLFAALSVGFFVSTLGTTQSALFVREMQFRLLELRQIVATVVGASAGISIALAHYGAWAIVGQQLAEAAASTVLLWYLSPWHPSFRFSMTSVRRLGGFAGNVFGENLLYQAGRNLSSLLIGRFLGPAALGTYALATNVILVPFSRIAGPLQQVFFPAFSRMNHDRVRMADVWIRATRFVGLISIPSLVGLAIVAPDFVHVVLGRRWSDATPVIQILAGVGLIQSLQTLSGEVLLALNRAGWLLRFTMLWFAGNVGAFALGLHWGILGVAACYAVATAVIEPVRTYLTSRALGISPWRFVRAFSGVGQATAVMAAVLLAVRPALMATGTPTAARLILLIVLGAVAYVAGCLWRAPELTSEIKNAFRRRTATAIAPIQAAEAGR
jgi:O-antigen/teichoic acid export membrane protein